ncbi:MAG TPA: hypothetical protein VJH92_04400 [Candidatus Nanoarchaeia archaeon]|nr:hypothetical protein [Candidatus Nanoarchaeia archaeon]
MAFSVSIRNFGILREGYEQTGKIPVSEEIKHNSDVIKNVLQYAPRILPRFLLLDENEVGNVSDSVAYLMRTDSIITNRMGIGPSFHDGSRRPVIYGEDGVKFHLLNNPSDLRLEFELPKEYWNRGGEFFRCYSATFDLMTSLKDKLSPEGRLFAISFPLADLTAYLLDTRDLVDYNYNKTEIDSFNSKLARQMNEV